MSQRRQLFLSYAHDDNRTAEEKQIGWVSYFRRALEAELGELASIWLDKREIEPDAFFDTNIETALESSDELITVLSRRWLERPYCLREFSLFLKLKGKEGSTFVHKILKEGVAIELHPEQIKKKDGVYFYRVLEDTGEELPFYDGYGDYKDREYWAAVRRVARPIKERIRTGGLQEQETQEAAETGIEPPANPDLTTIFVALPSPDQRDNYLVIVEELVEHGFRVLPRDANAINEAEDPAALLKSYLDQAKLSVHVLGSRPGYTLSALGSIWFRGSWSLRQSTWPPNPRSDGCFGYPPNSSRRMLPMPS